MEIPEPWFKIKGWFRTLNNLERDIAGRSITAQVTIQDYDLESSDAILNNLHWLRDRKMQFYIVYPLDEPETEEEEFRRLTQKVANDYAVFGHWIALLIKHDPVLAAHAQNHIEAYMRGDEI